MSSKEDFGKKFQKQLDIIQKKTGVNPKIILGILGVAALLTLIGILDKYITCIIGIVLPCYWSMKAIESKEADDDKQWLTYWAVYAVFTFFDLFANFILRLFPFYFFIKLIFLVWCFMPNTRGAQIIYDKILKRFFLKYESNIDKILDKGKHAAQKGKDFIETSKEKIEGAFKSKS